jgi:ABC-type transport system involved in multi-copper enzyme maturation permease subunit
MRFQNPVLDRALRGSLFHRPRFGAWLRVGVLLAADGLILGLAAYAHDLHRSWPHVTVLCMTTAIVAVIALSVASHAIASERESGALDMLLATMLTPGDVVRGKSAGYLISVAPLLAIGLAHGLVAAALTEVRFLTVVGWLVSSVVVTAFFSAVGLWASSIARTAGRAVLLAFAVLIGGTIVHATLMIVTVIVAAAANSEDVLFYAAGASPVYQALAPPLICQEDRWNHGEINGFCAWALWAAVYAAASLALVRWTRRSLERRYEAR